MGGVMTEVGERGPLTVAAVSATVVALSIATGMVLGGDISEALWVLLVPIGMFGGGVVTVIALVVFLARRTPRRDATETGSMT